MIEFLVLAGVTAAGGCLLLYLLRLFTRRPVFLALVAFPLASFSLGFSLRLSAVQRMIDMGFFLTDFSFLFIYLVFALAFLLGQLRYWKKA